MKLEIGKEYEVTREDFLSGLVLTEDFVTYIGRHPYDNRHIFASKKGGCVYVPENGRFFDRIEL